jgi:hypothetical protein
MAVRVHQAGDQGAVRQLQSVARPALKNVLLRTDLHDNALADHHGAMLEQTHIVGPLFILGSIATGAGHNLVGGHYQFRSLRHRSTPSPQ